MQQALAEMNRLTRQIGEIHERLRGAKTRNESALLSAESERLYGLLFEVSGEHRKLMDRLFENLGVSFPESEGER